MTSGIQGAARRLVTSLVALTATASLAAACAKAPAKAPPPKRPLSEHRALQLISKTVREFDKSPVKGGYIEVARGKNLKVDIGLGKLGVAYLTPAERRELAEVLPALKARRRTSLFIHSGRGNDLYVKVLVLTDASTVPRDASPTPMASASSEARAAFEPQAAASVTFRSMINV